MEKGVNCLNYIFLDLEWNQPQERAGIITDPVPLYGEVIRIGAVKTDEALNIIGKYHECVIPKYYKKMHYAVQKLTGLESGSITYGYKFPAAYSRFKDWCGKSSVIITWGDEDKKILESNILIHGMETDDSASWYDLQKLYAYVVVKDGRQYSLQSALTQYGLEQELKAHNALNDAVYTARIGRQMDLGKYLENYDILINEEEERLKRKKKEKFYKTFLNIPSIKAALRNPNIMKCRCPLCRRDMTSREWITVKDDIFINCADCGKHGDFFVRIKMRKGKNGSYSVTKRYTRLTSECMEYYERTAFKLKSVSEKAGLL